MTHLKIPDQDLEILAVVEVASGYGGPKVFEQRCALRGIREIKREDGAFVRARHIGQLVARRCHVASLDCAQVGDGQADGVGGVFDAQFRRVAGPHHDLRVDF